MDIEALKRRAKALDAAAEAAMAEPYFQDVIAWFLYLGLLRHNRIAPRRISVSMGDVLRAGIWEPRVLELLPAILVRIPEAITTEAAALPPDLAAVVDAIRRREPTPPFRGIPAQSYLHWLTSPVMDQAGRRLHFRTRPRARIARRTAFAARIAELRLQRGMTQKELADRFKLSLRVIRDLEQGKLTPSLQHVMKVLGALDHELIISKWRE